MPSGWRAAARLHHYAGRAERLEGSLQLYYSIYEEPAFSIFNFPFSTFHYQLSCSAASAFSITGSAQRREFLVYLPIWGCVNMREGKCRRLEDMWLRCYNNVV